LIRRQRESATRKFYESSLKSKRAYSIIVQAGEPEDIVQDGVVNKRQPGPTGEVLEKEIRGKKFKLDMSICQEL